MSHFRSALEKVGTGLLYGVGFGISAGVIYYFVNERMMQSMLSDQAAEKVVVTKHERVKLATSVLILGTLENQGTEPARVLNLQVDLFDKTGRFVDQCREYIAGQLRAGESRNFKVSCGDKDKPVMQHETYKIRINGGM